MIVRINQHDLDHPERHGGWATGGLAGPIQYIWPPGTNCFEVVILETDERNQVLARTFRQMQLRQIIPEALLALRGEQDRIVLRLDGPMEADELLKAFDYLTDSAGVGRYSFGPLRKFSHDPAGVMASIRIAPTADVLKSLCADAGLGLDRAVRLRAFCMPEEYVTTALAIEQIDDERWLDVLNHTSLMLGTGRTVQALHILTRRYSAMQARQCLLARLLPAPASPEPTNGSRRGMAPAMAGAR